MYLEEPGRVTQPTLDTLAARGLEEPFPVVLYVVPVFGSGGKKVLVQFWFKYILTT